MVCDLECTWGHGALYSTVIKANSRRGRGIQRKTRCGGASLAAFACRMLAVNVHGTSAPVVRGSSRPTSPPPHGSCTGRRLRGSARLERRASWAVRSEELHGANRQARSMGASLGARWAASARRTSSNQCSGACNVTPKPSKISKPALSTHARSRGESRAAESRVKSRPPKSVGVPHAQPSHVKSCPVRRQVRSIKSKSVRAPRGLLKYHLSRHAVHCHHVVSIHVEAPLRALAVRRPLPRSRRG
jgi:hypothetical protein